MSTPSLQSVLDHLLTNVLPAADEYAEAERQLSEAFSQDENAANWKAAADRAKRRASDLAVAIDGLTDRAHIATGTSKTAIRKSVGDLCLWPGGESPRTDALERVRAIANAYKHQELTDTSLPISSERDVLALGAGFGVDGWGVGKFGGVEVLITDKSGKTWKFLGDAVVSIAAWFRFLNAAGISLPTDPVHSLNVQVHP